MKTESDGTLYLGCATSLGSASLRAPTSVQSATNAVGGDGRRLRLAARARLRLALALPRAYACIEVEGDGAPYPGWMTPLGVAALASLRARASRLALALPRAYACIEVEGDGTPYPGCLTPLGSASLRALAYGSRLLSK